MQLWLIYSAGVNSLRGHVVAVTLCSISWMRNSQRAVGHSNRHAHARTRTHTHAHAHTRTHTHTHQQLINIHDRCSQTQITGHPATQNSGNLLSATAVCTGSWKWCLVSSCGATEERVTCSSGCNLRLFSLSINLVVIMINWLFVFCLFFLPKAT